jgi:hypothetical protein
MRRVIISLITITLINFSLSSQTKQASHSAALIKGVRTVNLINGLNISVDFNPEKETLWITGGTDKIELFITEFIPLSDPKGIKIEIGKSYSLDNLFAKIEYKILKIEDNKVTRIWFRVVATSTSLPDDGWI